MNLKIVALTAAALINTAPASAATLIVNADGKLTGASGVIVNGTSYDVSFADTTCQQAFSGCDATSDFIFNQAEAFAAAAALLDQVLLDDTAGNFDSDYTLTEGCSSHTYEYCALQVPYDINAAPTGEIYFYSYSAGNFNSSGDGVFGPNSQLNDRDLANHAFETLAVFRLPSAVPEPASWAMMLFGFGAIGYSMRRKPKLTYATA